MFNASNKRHRQADAQNLRALVQEIANSNSEYATLMS